MTTTTQPTAPAPVSSAIENASKTTGVPADVLAGIFRIEAGGRYPNPYVNTSGYGGLFGTPNTVAQGAPFNNFDLVATAEQQATLAASILAQNIRAHGSLAGGLSAYSGGSYTTVPGQTTPAGFTLGAPTPAQARAVGQQVLSGTITSSEAQAATGLPVTSNTLGIFGDLNPTKWVGELASFVKNESALGLAYVLFTLLGLALLAFGALDLFGYSPRRVAGAAINPLRASSEEIPF